MAALAPAAYADTIALWNFETNTPADITNAANGPTVGADVYTGIGTAIATGVHASANTDWTTPTGNGSMNAFSSNGWAAGDYYQFTLSTSNFESIGVKWDQTRSSTGPGLFDLAYSFDGSNFTVLLDNYSVGTTGWSTTSVSKASGHTVDLSAFADLNNASSVTFRLIAATAASGTTGASRIDNFLVTGRPSTSGAPPLFWDADGASGGLGGSGNWNGANWAANDTGAAPVQVFDPSKKAVFSGRGGDVVIDSADAVANNGIQFDSDQYTISGTNGRVLMLGGARPQISVTSEGHRSTITAALAGTNGFNKLGSGVLRLDADNSYTGATTITAGVLEITKDRSLGSVDASVTFNGGTLRTIGSMTLNSARSITGTGTLDVALNDTLTIDGLVNAGVITLSGEGTIRMNGAATLAGLVFNSPAAVNGAASLKIDGNLTASHVSGTSTITGPLSLGSFTSSSGNRVVTVTNAGATLIIPGPITLNAPATSNNGRLHKLGPGTLELTGDNSGLFGVRLGTTATINSGSTIARSDGGTIRIGNKNALGANLFQFNAGTLHIQQPLTGTNAVANAITIGASSTIPAVISGADVEFIGEIQLYRPETIIQHTLVVNANVFFTGPLNAPASADGLSSGLTIGGTGLLTLAAQVNTITEHISIAGPAVTLNGALSASAGVHIQDGTFQGNGALPVGTLLVGDGAGTDAIFSPGDGIATYPLGALRLDSDAVLRLEIDSLRRLVDCLSVKTTINLGDGLAKLELEDLESAVIAVGSQFRLIENGGTNPVTGYFESLPHLHRFTVGKNLFEIDYGSQAEPSDVILRVVPEPAVASILVIGIGVFGGVRRTRICN